MALTDKLTSIADAIREVGGTTAKLTPAEMPDAIAKLGESDYPTLVMYQGQPFTIACDLAKADGTAWEMPSSDTLALHMWHGADTLDASGSTATLSVDVPADAVTKLWHWTLVLTHGGTDYMVALGDAECRAEGTAKERRVAGVVDKARKVYTSASGQDARFSVSLPSATSFGDYAFQNSDLRHISAPNVTSIGEFAFLTCSKLESVEFPKVTSIEWSRFSQCSSLRSIELPSCTSAYLQEMANLERAYLPAATSVKAQGLTKLIDIYVPSVTSIDSDGFARCAKLRIIELPSCTSVTTRSLAYCNDLTVVLLPGETMCEAKSLGFFYGCMCFNHGSTVGRIYVNDNLVDDYKAATNWSAYANYIRPISEWDGTIPDLPGSTGWDD